MSRGIDTTIVSERATTASESVLLVTVQGKRWRITENEVAVLVSADDAPPEWQQIIEGNAVAGACAIATLQLAIELRTRFSQLVSAAVLPTGSL